MNLWVELQTCHIIIFINFLCLLLHWPRALCSSHPSFLSDFLPPFQLLLVSSFYSAPFLQHPPLGISWGPILPSSPQYLEQEELNPETEAQSSPCLPNFIASMSPSCFLFYCLSFSPAPQVALCSLFFIPFLLDSTAILLIKHFHSAKELIKKKEKRTYVPVR